MSTNSGLEITRKFGVNDPDLCKAILGDIHHYFSNGNKRMKYYIKLQHGMALELQFLKSILHVTLKDSSPCTFVFHLVP